MRRRELLTSLSGVMLAETLAAHAQQPAVPVIGFLRSTPMATAATGVAAFRQGLKDAGYIEGQNVAIEFRSADDRVERLPALVAELINRPVAVIVGNSPAALAAKAATKTVPIVFATGGDPVKEGFVSNLNRPGGNITGVSFLHDTLGPKQLELARELVPKAATIAVLIDSTYRGADVVQADIKAAAQQNGQHIVVMYAGNDADLEAAFSNLAQQSAGALIATGGPTTYARRDKIVTLAARYAVPTIYAESETVEAGGLISYGGGFAEAYRQVGNLAGKILKGAKPGDLPVQLGVEVELVVNLKTAKTLGLMVPVSLLARANQVIE